MTKQEIKEYYIGIGFSEDLYGHLQRKTFDGSIRIKFQKTTFRREAKATGTKLWINISSRAMYYSKMSIHPESKKLTMS